MHCILHSLRRSQTLARLVLAWFALTLGVAMASPLVAPRAMELVCSSGGVVQLVAVERDEAAATAGHHTLDCALCLGTTLPAVLCLPVAVQAHPLARALVPTQEARIAALVGAPLPPRGPPLTV